MGWMKCYEFKSINESINKKLNLSKEIRIISFSPVKKDICKDLHIGVYEDKKMIEDFYINPRKKIRIKSKYLNSNDKDILNSFIKINGLKLLDYQLYRTLHTGINNSFIFIDK